MLKSQRPLGLGCIAKLIAQALVLALSNQLNFPTLTCIGELESCAWFHLCVSCSDLLESLFGEALLC